MTIIDSLKRLERIGMESSRTTQKMKDATENVGYYIWEYVKHLACDRPVHLHGYEIKKITKTYPLYICNDGEIYYIFDKEYFPEDLMKYRLSAREDSPSRELCLRFSEALVSGLIDEVSDYVQKQKEQDEKAELIMNETLKSKE